MQAFKDNHVETQGPTPDAPRKIGPLWKILLLLVVGMSAFAYMRLSSNPAVIPTVVILLSILEAVRLVQGFKESKKLEAVCEAAYFVVLLSIFGAIYRDLLAHSRTLMLITVLYRPCYTLYCNRRLALALSLLIVAAVLPVTSGVVADADLASMLTGFYALLVLALWVFCSKLGAMTLGFAEGS